MESSDCIPELEGGQRRGQGWTWRGMNDLQLRPEAEAEMRRKRRRQLMNREMQLQANPMNERGAEAVAVAATVCGLDM